MIKVKRTEFRGLKFVFEGDRLQGLRNVIKGHIIKYSGKNIKT